MQEKGTGHHLGANSLISLMGDFNSGRAAQPRGMRRDEIAGRGSGQQAEDGEPPQ